MDFEQVSLFDEPQPIRTDPEDIAGKWYRPRTYYRFNERYSDDPAGWVKVGREYVGETYRDERGRLWISFRNERDIMRYGSARPFSYRIPREDIREHFEEIQKPGWAEA